MAQDNVKRTGVIGLGAMGLQMGRHMVRNGFEVHGYDISAEAKQRAESHGIHICASVSDVGNVNRACRAERIAADGALGGPGPEHPEWPNRPDCPESPE